MANYNSICTLPDCSDMVGVPTSQPGPYTGPVNTNTTKTSTTQSTTQPTTTTQTTQQPVVSTVGAIQPGFQIKGKDVTSPVERSIFDAIQKQVQDRQSVIDYIKGARQDNSNAGLFIIEKLEKAAKEGQQGIGVAFDEIKKARDEAIKALAAGYATQLGALQQALASQRETMRRTASSGLMSEGAAETALEKGAKAFGQAALSSYAVGAQALGGIEESFMRGTEGLAGSWARISQSLMAEYPQTYGVWQTGEQNLLQQIAQFDQGSPIDWLLKLSQATYWKSQTL